MSRRGVDGKFGNCTEGSCPFIATVDGFAFGFVDQLMGGGVDVAATTRLDSVLDDKSATKVQ